MALSHDQAAMEFLGEPARNAVEPERSSKEA
jgi:hypothetical protein